VLFYWFNLKLSSSNCSNKLTNRVIKMKESTKVLVAMTALFSLCGAADFATAECSEVYLKVGAGYKFSENDSVTLNGQDYEIDNAHPISARFEIAKECGNVSFGVAHHSQWATGAPFNDKKEYQKSELYIDYKFSLGF
jgi:hypothetical protein